jgi:deoxyadenosine/deoxycytidine kinase
MATTEESKTPITVVIDGEIGAGKTTLIEHVRKALEARGVKAVVVPEPVGEWKRVGILQAFYADKPPELRGPVTYNFQTYTFLTRIQETQRVVAEHPDADVYLLERSVLTDRFVFMELQREMVGPILMEMYDKWWGLWTQLMPIQPQKIIYLKPTIDNCQSRVAARAREGEVGEGGGKTADETDREEASARGGVSAGYQARLRRAHEAYLQGLHPDEFPGMPPRPFAPENVIVVDGTLADHDFSAPGPAADETAAHIVKKILGE